MFLKTTTQFNFTPAYLRTYRVRSKRNKTRQVCKHLILMGIPFYFRVIAAAHPSILSTVRPVCHKYYVDFNGMVHQAAQRVIRRETQLPASVRQTGQLEDDICNESWAYLQECVKELNPTDSVHVCIDGVAPVAKMLQQRKRRYLSMKRWQLLQSSPLWDTNAITPGTNFMTHLQQSLSSHISKLGLDGGHVQHILSAADEVGEGEHKIFASIASDMNITTPNNEAICIYGLDADLIMLSLMAHRPNIYLMRESEQIGVFTYLDIDKLRMGILKEISDTYKWPCKKTVFLDMFGRDARDVIESYLVMCFFLGNDFLPHITSLSLKKDGHCRLLTAAKCINGVLVKDGAIHIEGIMGLLRELQRDENDVVLTINDEYMKRRYICRDGLGISNIDAYPMQDGNKDIKLATAIALAGHKWRSVYYKHCFDARVNDTSIVVSACKSFLTGIFWTYAYYKRQPKDCMWTYPYGYAPTIQDLANYIQVSREDFVNLLATWEVIGQTPSFVHPDVQLLAVLPPASVPAHLRVFVDDPAKGCAHLFPVNYKIKTYLFSKLWECSPVLPPIDVDLIKRCLQVK